MSNKLMKEIEGMFKEIELIFKEILVELNKTNVGKVFVDGIRNALINTVDEIEKSAKSFTETQLQEKIQTMKDTLKGDDNGEKETREDIEQ